MVKKIAVIVGVIVLIAILGNSYLMFNKSVKMQNSLENLEQENQELLKKKQNLEEVVRSLDQEADESKKQIEVLASDLELEKIKGQETEQSLLEAEKSLEEAVNLIDEIKLKLNTTIDPLVKIQQITNENETLRDVLNNQSEEVTEEPIEVIDYTSTFAGWISDLENIDGLLESRMTELETIVSSLSELSLERIMIQSEIEFLNNIQDEMNEVVDDIDK